MKLAGARYARFNVVSYPLALSGILMNFSTDPGHLVAVSMPFQRRLSRPTSIRSLAVDTLQSNRDPVRKTRSKSIIYFVASLTGDRLKYRDLCRYESNNNSSRVFSFHLSPPFKTRSPIETRSGHGRATFHANYLSRGERVSGNLFNRQNRTEAA